MRGGLTRAEERRSDLQFTIIWTFGGRRHAVRRFVGCSSTRPQWSKSPHELFVRVSRRQRYHRVHNRTAASVGPEDTGRNVTGQNGPGLYDRPLSNHNTRENDAVGTDEDIVFDDDRLEAAAHPSRAPVKMSENRRPQPDRAVVPDTHPFGVELIQVNVRSNPGIAPYPNAPPSMKARANGSTTRKEESQLRQKPLYRLAHHALATRKEGSRSRTPTTSMLNSQSCRAASTFRESGDYSTTRPR
jgi:hypothetical protein